MGGQRTESRGVDWESGSRQKKSVCKKLRDERKGVVDRELHEARYGWCTEDGSTVPHPTPWMKETRAFGTSPEARPTQATNYLSSCRVSSQPVVPVVPGISREEMQGI